MLIRYLLQPKLMSEAKSQPTKISEKNCNRRGWSQTFLFSLHDGNFAQENMIAKYFLFFIVFFYTVKTAFYQVLELGNNVDNFVKS